MTRCRSTKRLRTALLPGAISNKTEGYEVAVLEWLRTTLLHSNMAPDVKVAVLERLAHRIVTASQSRPTSSIAFDVTKPRSTFLGIDRGSFCCAQASFSVAFDFADSILFLSINSGRTGVPQEGVRLAISSKRLSACETPERPKDLLYYIHYYCTFYECVNESTI